MNLLSLLLNGIEKTKDEIQPDAEHYRTVNYYGNCKSDNTLDIGSNTC